MTAIGAGKVTSAMLAGSIDATKIADGSVTSTEFQFLNTVTSNIQTQIDGKQPLDSDLTTIAGLTPTTDNFIVAVSSAWASRTPAQVKTTLALNNVVNVDTSNASNISSGTLAAGRMPALTGDITTSAGAVATAIGANKVTLAMMATMATASLLGRNTAGTGNVEVLSAATAKALLGLVNVDNTSDATKNAAVATLTNKTLTSPVINTPTINLQTTAGSSDGVFSLDATTSNSITIANNATNQLNAVGGLVVINDPTQTGSTGLFLVGGSTVILKVGETSTIYSTTKDNSGTLNFYVEAGGIFLQNKTGASITVRVMYLKMRGSL